MGKASKTPEVDWWNNAIQFPRIIEEASAAGAFTTEVVRSMADSMDLRPRQVLELIDRATAIHEHNKDQL